MFNNNGSSFAGIKSNVFYNMVGGFGMLIGRYWIIISVLAIAGSFARKKFIPNSSGTLPTDNLLFVSILVFFIIMIGSLIFLPAFLLGPVLEHLIMLDN
jgi:K+-transporting ATPase ATPase A chain